jgi:type II secretory pathway pseudopilin PulG
MRKYGAALRAFTLLELLAIIAIVAVIATVVFAFAGNYMSWARLTAVRHTVAVLNEGLNEYRTLGGISKSHSLEGETGTTQNSTTLTQAVIDAMKSGFTISNTRKNFLSSQQGIDTTVIGSTGQGLLFHFTADEDAVLNKVTQSEITITPNKTAIVPGSEVVFTASGGDGDGEYVWGGAASGTGTTQTVTAPTSGDFTVTVYRIGDSQYKTSATASLALSVLTLGDIIPAQTDGNDPNFVSSVTRVGGEAPYPCWYMADDNSSTKFWAYTGDSVYTVNCGYHFNTPKTVVGFSITLNYYSTSHSCGAGCAKGYLKYIKLQYSDNGPTWSDVPATFTNPEGNVTVKLVVPVSNTLAKRWWRVSTQFDYCWCGSTNNYIMEVELFEVMPEE